jgi:hypothetical protein
MKALALAIGMTAIAAADDLRLTVHMVAMEPGKLTELLGEPGGLSIAKAREMVKAGEARLFDTMMIRAQDGARATLISEEEVIYPTEYEPPGLPNSKEYEERVRRRMDGWARAFRFMPVQGAWPGHFETRMVGEVLELHGEREEAAALLLELVRYARDTVFQEIPSPEGKPFRVRFPEFERLAINSKMEPGDWLCAGILTKPGDDGGPGEKIVVFARVERLKFGE